MRLCFTSKLIRDRIPEIAREKGEHLSTHVASEAEYASALRAKLLEEVHEFLDSGSSEELGDILEVIDAICSFEKIDRASLLRQQLIKARSRGRFSNRIILD